MKVRYYVTRWSLRKRPPFLPYSGRKLPLHFLGALKLKKAGEEGRAEYFKLHLAAKSR